MRMSGFERDELDRHITGNWGEDSVPDDEDDDDTPQGDLIAWQVWDGTETQQRVIAATTSYGVTTWTLRAPDGHTERFEELPEGTFIVERADER